MSIVFFASLITGGLLYIGESSPLINKFFPFKVDPFSVGFGVQEANIKSQMMAPFE